MGSPRPKEKGRVRGQEGSPHTRKDTQPRRNVGLRSRAAQGASNDTANAALDLDAVKP
jgi:hypothetical protein